LRVRKKRSMLSRPRGILGSENTYVDPDSTIGCHGVTCTRKLCKAQQSSTRHRLTWWRVASTGLTPLRGHDAHDGSPCLPMGIPAVEARQRFTTCAVACPAPTHCGIVPDRSSWILGSSAPPWSEKRTSFLKAIAKERLPGEKGDNNWVGRHRHSHAPGMQQEPPLIVRQVSSHAASSGCSLPASRSPRAPVREGQRQRLPAPTSALSSPTAQRGMVFAPSASRRQRSPGKTLCVAGGEKQRAPSSSERDALATPRRHTTLGTTEASCP